MTFFSSDANKYEPSSKLPFFPADFNGRLRVDACKGVLSERSGRAFIVEFTVLSSNRQDITVGSRRSWYQSMKEAGTAYPTCIAFLYAALGVTEGKDQARIDKDIKPRQDVWLNWAINEDPTSTIGLTPEQIAAGKRAPLNALANAEVNLQTFEKKTRAASALSIEDARKMKGGIFTVHNFSVPSAATKAA